MLKLTPDWKQACEFLSAQVVMLRLYYSGYRHDILGEESVYSLPAGFSWWAQV